MQYPLDFAFAAAFKATAVNGRLDVLVWINERYAPDAETLKEAFIDAFCPNSREIGLQIPTPAIHQRVLEWLMDTFDIRLDWIHCAFVKLFKHRDDSTFRFVVTLLEHKGIAIPQTAIDFVTKNADRETASNLLSIDIPTIATTENPVHVIKYGAHVYQKPEQRPTDKEFDLTHGFKSKTIDLNLLSATLQSPHPYPRERFVWAFRYASESGNIEGIKTVLHVMHSCGFQLSQPDMDAALSKASSECCNEDAVVFLLSIIKPSSRVMAECIRKIRSVELMNAFLQYDGLEQEAFDALVIAASRGIEYRYGDEYGEYEYHCCDQDIKNVLAHPMRPSDDGLRQAYATAIAIRSLDIVRVLFAYAFPSPDVLGELLVEMVRQHVPFSRIIFKWILHLPTVIPKKYFWDIFDAEASNNGQELDMWCHSWMCEYILKHYGVADISDL
jgi:hypothetical protein